MKIYAQQRFDEVADNVAVIRGKVDAMERNLDQLSRHTAAQTERLTRVEKRVFAVWLLGPVALGTVALLGTLRTWLMGK